MTHSVLPAVAILVSMLVTSAALAQSTFTLGSTMAEVRAVQGEPDRVNRYTNSEHWQHEFSTVEFSTQTNLVTSLANHSNNLRAELRPGGNVTTDSHYTIGSHNDDVLCLQGTPDTINRYTNSRGQSSPGQSAIVALGTK